MRQLFIAIAVLSATTQSLSAGESFWKIPSLTSGWPDCIGKFCCDDYCPKPAPCVTGKTRFTCPDYCGKPFPSLPSGKTSFLCDDYRRKPLPPTCCLSAKNLRCIPSRLPLTSKPAEVSSMRPVRNEDGSEIVR